MEELEKLLEENEKLKEELAKYEGDSNCDHLWCESETWPTFSDKNMKPTKVIDVKACTKCGKIGFNNERFVKDAE